MKDDKILLKGLLAAIVLISFSGLVVFGVADDPPTGPEVTITWDHPGQNSYYDLKITWPDGTTETYPGWCADSEVFVSGHDYILVSSCDPSQIPASAFNDEHWCNVTILLNQWQTSNVYPYNEANWVHIQQVIWYYTDFGYDIYDPQSPVPMDDDWEKLCNAIILDVNTLAAVPGACDDLPCVLICVAPTNPGGHQLLFFMIPEIPLGTLGAGLTMLSAYMVKRKRTKTQ